MGTLAKALFDDEEHWYPCMVMAVEPAAAANGGEGARAPPGGPRPRGFVYTLEYFDGDTRAGVPGAEVVAMPQAEARAHMADLAEVRPTIAFQVPV